MEETIIEKTLRYVRKFFESDASGHDYFHTYRVYKLAMSLADSEKCDREIVALAALLHDVDDIKLVGKEAVPYQNARSFLRENEYPEERIERIVKAVSEVSYKGKDSLRPSTVEGMIVQDADRLDAIGAIGIARTFAYGGSRGSAMHDPDMKPLTEMDAETYHNHRGTTINHFYEKLLLLKDMMNTERAKEMAEARHRYMEEFLKEFYAEWEGER